MAKVATRGPMIPESKPLLFSGSLNGGSSSGCSNGANGIKRKTPSELRGEQLKRKNIVEIMDESPAPEFGSLQNANAVTSESLKPILLKNPRYINTHVDEMFPSRKNSLRLKLLSRKENVKENTTADHFDCLKNSSFSLNLDADRQPQCSGPKDTHATTSSTQSNIENKKCSVSTFRSVMELSTGGEKTSGFSLDMDEAFKGLAARPSPNISTSHNESFDGKKNSTSAFCSEFIISGHKIPLDFTLKTSIHVIASSSVSWFHRLMSEHIFNGSTAQISNTKALYSWVYPQSSLPPSVISALSLSSKGEGQTDFLTKRQLAWEASFRSLYVMLRKNICNLFYVCTGQFVAMFTNNNTSTESKTFCNAYVSQSTRNLRSLLKEQDISYNMPLCHSKVEQVTTEDLFELSEIEKHNLGKTRRTVSLSEMDNTPESLLAFSDNNVHGLYDFLLNYRFLLPSLNVLDVPLLYSPVPFENAAVSTPEVKCKEVKRINYVSALTTSEPKYVSASTSYYTIEIRDAYIPPWLTSSVCDTLRSNSDNSFEARDSNVLKCSFVVEPMSIGLNVGLDMVNHKLEPKVAPVEALHDASHSFRVKGTVVSSHLSCGFLKGLKYSDDSYTVSLSPV
ncbi:hypothetical protein E3N88_43603 [Mikania micrantha]|uniref:Uncharacterized protein n=1 Tax=Mikania micrantha TaxID=192012 RepID=A0A5N6LEG9_9ASTR|nr:hypothetical protein E3N88_43603 [Mikania micrantha]